MKEYEPAITDLSTGKGTATPATDDKQPGKSEKLRDRLRQRWAKLRTGCREADAIGRTWEQLSDSIASLLFATMLLALLLALLSGGLSRFPQSPDWLPVVAAHTHWIGTVAGVGHVLWGLGATWPTRIARPDDRDMSLCIIAWMSALAITAGAMLAA